MECGDPNVVSRYVEGSLRDDERADVELHVDECGECRALIAELARALGEPETDGTPSVHSPILTEDRIGRYVVKGWLGEGAMGVVYRAEDPQLERDVALKLVRTGEAGVVRRTERLLREATLMARIAHPNVVSVYDAGYHEGRVYLAQELVAGTTLARWQRDNHDGLKPLVARWLEAGRGLAAAHAAGVLHRDFKPSNVLVGSDGRARVTDFGLARRGTELALDSREPRAAPGNSLSTGLVGTPRYMAPEQREGAATPKSDQYSYAVGLREALAAEVEHHGKVRIPKAVTRMLDRATQEDPAARFDSMDALLAALEVALHPAPWTALTLVLVAGLALVLVGAGFAVHARQIRASCEDFGRELADLEPGKRSVGADVVKAIDSWSAKWVTEKRESCLATRVRGTQSEELLELRTTCLEQQRRAVSTLLALIATPGEVQAPWSAVQELPTPDTCADARELLEPVRMPSDPQTRLAIAGVRRLLDEATAYRLAGRYKTSLDIVSRARDQLTPLHYRPLECDLERIAGGLHSRLGNSKEAEAAFQRAILAGVAGRNDKGVVRAYIGLIFGVGYEQRRFEDAHRLAEQGEAALERFGSVDELRGKLDRSLCVLHYTEGRPEEALPYGERSVRLLEREYGTDHFDTALARQYYAIALVASGHLEEAAVLTEHAVASLEVAHGDPSQLAAALDDLGSIRFEQDRVADALALHQRAVTLIETIGGPQHHDLAFVLPNVAQDQAALGQRDAALQSIARAQTLAAGAFGKDHIEVAKIIVVRARLTYRAGAARDPALDADLERAERITRLAQGSQRDRAGALFWFARTLGHAECARATTLASEARTLLVATKEPQKREHETPAALDAWLAASGCVHAP